METIDDLRNILSEEIDNLRAGKSTAATVNAIVNASGKIMSSIKLELEYTKLCGGTPMIPMMKHRQPQLEKK